MRRADDAVQFGLDPAHTVVLDGLTPPLARMVACLDGTRGVGEVVADAVADGADPAAARDALGRLHAAGLLTGPPSRTEPTAPGPPRRPRASAAVVVHGGGRVGVAIACLLAGSGVGRVQVVADGVVLGHDTGTGLVDGDVGRPAAIAAAEAVARAGGAAAWAGGEVARHEAPRVIRPDLVVLADGAVPDPVLSADLTARGRPHLVVAVHDDRGTVGPLVLPGRTACVRCEELGRAEADPAWPRLAAQLATHRPPAALAVATVTAAVAATQVLALVDAAGGPVDCDDSAETPGPAVIGAVVEVDARRGGWRRRPCRPHPGCSCRPTGCRTSLRAGMT